MTRALLIVDVQNDFLPGGALAVERGDEVVEVANRMMGEFEYVFASQDWHPANHCSFADNHVGRTVGEVVHLDGLEQTMWPVHCVQNTHGAEFPAELDTQRISAVIQKGIDPEIDSYSAFYDNGRRRDTDLARQLREKNVDQVYVLGLATDYCVKFTAIDAAGEGFQTWLIEDGCRGVELRPGDCRQAIDDMRESGVQILTSDQVPTA